MLKRDIQGKFALKNEDHRKVRSLRLTDETWKVIGIAAECLGLTRADYLEHIVRHQNLPSITRYDSEILDETRQEIIEAQPSITRHEELHQKSDPNITERAVAPPLMPQLEILRERVLSELRLGKQAPRYKAAQKAQDLRKDTRYRVGSNKLHGNRGVFEFLNQVLRKPLVFQLINGLRGQDR